MSNLKEQKTANVINFEEVVQLGLQQKESRLSPLVQVKHRHGEMVANVQTFFPTEAYTVPRDVHFSETMYNQTPQARRWIDFENHTWAEIVDPFIENEQDIDAFASYVPSAVSAFNRLKDQVIMKGMLGKNTTGANRDTPEFFPEENVIRASKTLATDKLALRETFAGKLLDAQAWFAERDVDIDLERIVVAIPPYVHRSLFDIDQVINRDYVGAANLDAGRVRYFADTAMIPYRKIPGHFQFPEEIQIKGWDTDKNYYCPVWCTSAVELGIWNDVDVSFDRLPTHNNAKQLLAQISMGAARLEPNKIVCIEVPKSEDEIARLKASKEKAKKHTPKKLSEISGTSAV